nr:MAG: putative RNA-dependent RNA-polymerase [XiangYun hepe-virga-like virus 6]
MPFNVDSYMTEKETGVDGVNRLLCEYLPNLPVSSQVLVNRLLSSDGGNQLKDYLANGIADTVRATSSSIRNKSTLTVGEILTSLEERRLCDLYPELTLKFTRNNFANHPFAAASRKCERMILLAKCGYQKCIDYGQTLKETSKDVFVKEVGGDPTRSIKNKERYVHHCAPVLDSYDQSRFAQRRHLASIYRADALSDPEIKTAALNYLRRSEHLMGCKQFCFKKSQECTVTSEVLMALHSVYDIHPSEFADSMESAKANLAYGSFMYTPLIFLKNKGNIPALTAHYEHDYDEENYDGKPYFNPHNMKGTIKFGFLNDDGFNYHHDLKNYVAWVTSTKIIARSGASFNLELLENRGGVQFFKVTRDMVKIVSPAVPRRLSFSQLKDFYLVTFYDIDVSSALGFVSDKGNGKNPWDNQLRDSNLVMMKFIAPKKLVNKCSEYVRASVEDKFKPESVYGFLRSLGTRTVFSNSVIEENHGLTIKELAALSLVIYISTYESKFRDGKTLQNVMKAITYQRNAFYSSLGFWKKWKSAPPSVDSGPGWFETLLLKIFGKGPYAGGCIDVNGMLVDLDFSIPMAATVCGYGGGVPAIIFEDNPVDKTFEDELAKLTGVEGKKDVVNCDHCSWHSSDGFKETGNELSPRICEPTAGKRDYMSLLTIADSAGALSRRNDSASKNFVFRLSVIGDTRNEVCEFIKTRRETPVVFAESDIDLAVIDSCEKDWLQHLAAYYSLTSSNGRLLVYCRTTDTLTLTSVLRYVSNLFELVLVACDSGSLGDEVVVAGCEKRHGLRFPSVEPRFKKNVYKYAQDLLKPKLLHTRDRLVGIKREVEPVHEPVPASDNKCRALVPYFRSSADHKSSHEECEIASTILPITAAPEERLEVLKVSGMRNNCAYKTINNNRECDYDSLRVELKRMDPDNVELAEETAPMAEAGDAMMSVFSSDRKISINIKFMGMCRNIDPPGPYYWRSLTARWENRHYDLMTACLLDRDHTRPYPSFSDETFESLMALEPRMLIGSVDEHPYTLVQGFMTDCAEHGSCFSLIMDKIPTTKKRNYFVGERCFSKIYCENVRVVKKFDLHDYSLFEILTSADLVLVPPVEFTDTALAPPTEFKDAAADSSSISDLESEASTGLVLSDYHKVQILPMCDTGLFDHNMQVEILGMNSSEIHVLTRDGKIVEYLEMCNDVRSSYSRFLGHVVNFVVRSEYNNIGRIVAALKTVGKSVEVEITPSPDKYFSPKFLIETDLQSLVYNSMEEQRALWSYEATVLTESLSREFKKAENLVLNGGDLNCFTDNSLCIYDTRADKFVLRGRGSKKRHQWGYSRSGLVSTGEFFSDETKRAGLRKTWIDKHPIIVFNSKSVLVHGIKLSSLYGKMDLTVDMPPMRMIQGVPGAGKSYTILQRNRGRIDNLILTVTREARDDLRRRAKTSSIGVPEERIRTVDSFMLTPTVGVDTVWLDEALLKHVGSWFWIAHLSKCREMYVVGDKAQIPYIERSGVKVKYSLPTYIDPDEYLNVTRRCPLDVTAWMNKRNYYECRVTSTSEVTKSVKGKLIEASAEIPRDPATKYLTFTQTEKETLAKEGYDCSTVHEYQGNQNASVALVRLTPKESNQIYKSKAHILVALTRHTQSFTYYSVLNDAVMKEVEYLESLAPSDVLEFAHLKGGGDPRVPIRETYKNGGLTITRTIKEEGSATIYHKDRLIVSILHDHGNTGALSHTINTDYNYEEDNLDLGYCQEQPVVVLQCWLDSVLPGSSLYDRYYDHELFEVNEYNTHLQDVILGQREPRSVKHDRMRPVLRTSIQPPVLSTQRQVVKGFLERNGNVPVLQGDVDEFQIAKACRRPRNCVTSTTTIRNP